MTSPEKVLVGAKALLAMLTSFLTSSSPLCFALHGSQENSSVCREAVRMGMQFRKRRFPLFTEKQIHSFMDYCKTKSLYIIFFASLL